MQKFVIILLGIASLVSCEKDIEIIPIEKIEVVDSTEEKAITEIVYRVNAPRVGGTVYLNGPSGPETHIPIINDWSRLPFILESGDEVFICACCEFQSLEDIPIGETFEIFIYGDGELIFYESITIEFIPDGEAPFVYCVEMNGVVP